MDCQAELLDASLSHKYIKMNQGHSNVEPQLIFDFYFIVCCEMGQFKKLF